METRRELGQVDRPGEHVGRAGIKDADDRVAVGGLEHDDDRQPGRRRVPQHLERAQGVEVAGGHQEQHIRARGDRRTQLHLPDLEPGPDERALEPVRAQCHVPHQHQPRTRLCRGRRLQCRVKASRARRPLQSG